MSRLNRAYFTISNTPGASGDLTVSTAESGPYRTLGAAQDGLAFDVSIVDGSAWEVRTGCVYTHSGTTLSRGTLEDSSTGSAITLTSAAKVMVTATAAWERSRMGLAPVLPFGQFGAPVNWTGNPVAIAMTANRQYAGLYRNMTQKQIDAVSFRVTVAGAGGTVAKCGIYGITSAAALSGPPNVELLATSNTVAVDSTGVKECTFSTPLYLPDWFYLLWVSDGAPTLNVFTGTNSAWFSGMESSLNHYAGFILNSAGLTLPSSFSGFAGIAVNGGIPLCYLMEA